MQVAQAQASEAENNQIRTEQELASAWSDLQTALSQHPASSSQTAELRSQLRASQMRADDLQVSLASAESALMASEKQLPAAHERVQQLELSTSHAMLDASQQQPDFSAQLYPAGLSQICMSSKNSNGVRTQMSSNSVADDTNEVLQVQCIPLKSSCMMKA